MGQRDINMTNNVPDLHKILHFLKELVTVSCITGEGNE